MITEEHAKPPPIAVPSQVNSSPNSFTFSTLLEKSRVVHNHPSGDPTPTPADIHMTKAIAKIAIAGGHSIEQFDTSDADRPVTAASSCRSCVLGR